MAHISNIRINDPYRGELEPRQPGRWKRIIVATLVFLLALFVIALGLLWYNLNKLSINPLAFGPLNSTNGRTNVLVLGVGDKGHTGQNLSDSMMVVSINHRTNEVAMIGIPRDLRVRIPDYGYSKINAANAYGGPGLAESTVSDTLGIPIHYYIKTNFSGLKEAVDAVGGIDVTVKDRLYDPEYPCADNEDRSCGIDIKPGNYHMDGTMALQYSRCRKGTCGNDFGRAARQQEVILLLKEKIATPQVYLNPATDSALLAALGDNAETDLSVNKMIEVGWKMKHAKRTINFVLSTKPGGFLVSSGGSDLLPIGGDFSEIQSYIENIFTEPDPTKEAQ